jgi:hypothetical protein
MIISPRGLGTGNTAAASIAVTLTSGPLLAGDLLLIAVGMTANANTVSSIVESSPGSGTFTQLSAVTSTNRALALWLGYGFSGYGVTFTITTTGTALCYAYHHLSSDLAWGSAPSVASSTANSGTSTSASTNAVTPTAGNLLAAALIMESTTADSTARTHTGNTFWTNLGSEYSTTATRIELAWGLAPNAVSTSEAWTLGSSVNWAATLDSITPPAGALTTATGRLVKGQLTDALDVAAGA